MQHMWMDGWMVGSESDQPTMAPAFPNLHQSCGLGERRCNTPACGVRPIGMIMEVELCWRYVKQKVFQMATSILAYAEGLSLIMALVFQGSCACRYPFLSELVSYVNQGKKRKGKDTFIEFFSPKLNTGHPSSLASSRRRRQASILVWPLR